MCTMRYTRAIDLKEINKMIIFISYDSYFDYREEEKKEPNRIYRILFCFLSTIKSIKTPDA